MRNDLRLNHRVSAAGSLSRQVCVRRLPVSTNSRKLRGAITREYTMAVDRRSFLSASSSALAGTLFADSGATVPADGRCVDGTPAPKPAVSMGASADARSKTQAGATEALATHAVNVKYADLDARTVANTKRRVLDLIGCALGGVPGSGNEAMVDLLEAWGGKPEASVIGYPVKGPAAQVAMTNAIIARSYDFEVMTAVVAGQPIASHHSPTTCMTALALCERSRLSGEDFLAALTVGDDIAARMLAASGLDFGQGWDGAPVYSAIAATAIAARLSGLTPQQTRDAFGLTIDTIAGTVQNIWDGATDWKLPQGLAARNGIFCAELARRKWVGVGDALLAPYGFYKQYTAGCAHPELLTADLGNVYYAEEYFKPYPACAATHIHIECTRSLRSKHAISPADIAQVIVRSQAPTGFVGKPFEARRYPHCDANFSIQFQVANVLWNGTPRQEHYAEDWLRSERLNGLVRRISLAPQPSGEKGVTIEIVLNDGTRIVERHPGPPLSAEAKGRLSTQTDGLAKFRQQIAFSGFVSDETAEEIIRRIDRIEQERDMAEFVGLLTRSYLPASRRA